MNKNEYLKVMKKAQKEYDSYLYNIKNIINDDFTLNEFNYVNKKHSTLYKCLRENQVQAKNILGGLFYDKLESLHSSWFDEIRKIFNICKKKSWRFYVFNI